MRKKYFFVAQGVVVANGCPGYCQVLPLGFLFT